MFVENVIPPYANRYNYLDGVKFMALAGAKMTEAAIAYLDRNGIEVVGLRELRVSLAHSILGSIYSMYMFVFIYVCIYTPPPPYTYI